MGAPLRNKIHLPNFHLSFACHLHQKPNTQSHRSPPFIEYLSFFFIHNLTNDLQRQEGWKMEPKPTLYQQ